MTVYLMIRRKKTNIFLDTSESGEIVSIKKMLRGIIGREVEDQELYYLKESSGNYDLMFSANAMDDDTVESAILLQNDKRLIDYFISTNHAKPQSPAIIGLSLRTEDGSFEPLDIVPYSTPPPLPDIMNPTATKGNGVEHGNHQESSIKKD